MAKKEHSAKEPKGVAVYARAFRRPMQWDEKEGRLLLCNNEDEPTRYPTAAAANAAIEASCQAEINVKYGHTDPSYYTTESPTERDAAAREEREARAADRKKAKTEQLQEVPTTAATEPAA